MNNQEIFDKVVAHARAQHEKSVDEHGAICRYRGPRGLMCFAGALLPDELYSFELEGHGLNSSLATERFEKAGFTADGLTLLRSLQRIHDCWDVEYWEPQLALDAERFNLKYTRP